MQTNPARTAVEPLVEERLRTRRRGFDKTDLLVHQ